MENLKQYQDLNSSINETIVFEYNTNVSSLVVKEGCSYVIYNYSSKGFDLVAEKNSNVTIIACSLEQVKQENTITLQKNATVTMTNIVLGTNSKIDLHVELQEYSTFKADILAIAKDDQQNIHTNVKHLAKSSKSYVNNYGVSSISGSCNFKTVGHVINNAKMAVVKQLTRGFILANNGIVKAEPILLIDEFDVEANHGAAIGKLSEDDLFYLMSRGLSKKEAELLILKAIIDPFIAKVDEKHQELVLDSINKKM